MLVQRLFECPKPHLDEQLPATEIALLGPAGHSIVHNLDCFAAHKEYMFDLARVNMLGLFTTPVVGS